MKIVIDGIIGSGKTTQIGLLEKIGWCVRREPIDKWPLGEFYKDQSRWAFLLHMKILQTLRPVHTHRPVIYERSLVSSRWVFWPILQKHGRVTKAEHEAYDAFYNDYIWYPDLYIFLDKNVKTAYDHIQERKQVGDSGVSLEYMYELDKEYRKIFTKMPCRLHIVDANRSVLEIHREICTILAGNELLVGDRLRAQVQKEGDPGRQVPCPPFTDMCRVS